MRIDLKKFFSREDATLRIEYSFSMSEIEVDGYLPFVSPIFVVGGLHSSAGAVRLEAELSYNFSMPCNRCMEEHFTACNVKVSHALVRSLSEEDNDSFILVEDDSLDLDELFYSDIVLELPVKYICKEDCKGLCPTCGINLNLESCNCSSKKSDSHFEILKSLIE